MFNKLVRLGQDAELRYLPSGSAVTNLSCVYDVGFGDKKRSQWLDAVVFGKQAEALAQYLTKGKQIVIYADDMEVETFTKNDGTTNAKLKCRVVNIDLTSGGQAPQGQAPAQQGGYQQAPQQQAPVQQQQQGHQQQQAPQQGSYQQPQQQAAPQQQGGYNQNGWQMGK